MRVSRLIIIVLVVAALLWVAHRKSWFGQVHQAVAESFSAYYARGQALYMRERYEGAIEVLRRAVEIDPKDSEAPDALRRMGECYKRLNRNDKAIECYERILREYPDYRMTRDVRAAIEKIKVEKM